LEREKIKERTKRGMMARMQSGKLKPGPRPLYGYRWADEERGRLVIDETTAPHVRRMFTLCAEGATLRQIANRLNAEGVASPQGRLWVYSNLTKLLRHQGYMGVAIQNRTAVQREGGKSVRVARPVEEQIVFPDGTIPPIISSDLFHIVQGRLIENQRQAVRNCKYPESFLLRGGFLRCPCCGCVARQYTSNDKGRLRHTYRIRWNGATHRNCPTCNVEAAVLDRAVWNHVRALVMHPDIVRQEVERLRHDDPNAENRAAVTRSLAENTRKRDNLTRALADIDDPDIRAGILAQLTGFSQRIRELQGELETLAAQSEAWEIFQVRLASLTEWLETVSVNIDRLTYDQKRELLSALDVQILLYPSDHTPRWEIRASLPLDEPDEDKVVYRSSRCCSGHPSP
jgi:hypothetical protein